MACNVQNNSQIKLGELESLLHQMVDFVKNKVEFDQYPDIVFEDDPSNGSKMLGKTAFYDPNHLRIHIFTNNRHPKDMLRSIAHELIHHKQNEDGFFSTAGFTGAGYAQKNPHMREMERQAYELGNMCFRDWEDGIKQENPTIYNEWRNNNMSTKRWKNNELHKLLLEKWGFGKQEEAKEELEEELEEGVYNKDEEEPKGELNEEGSDCISDYMSLHGRHTYREAVAHCKDEEELEESDDPRSDEEWEERGHPTFTGSDRDDFLTRKYGSDKSKWPGNKRKQTSVKEGLKLAKRIIARRRGK